MTYRYLFRAIFATVCLLFSSALSAESYDFVINGIEYKIPDKAKEECMVYGMLSNVSDWGTNNENLVTIPSKVTNNGKIYAVKSIDEFAFESINTKRIYISDGIEVIGERAFCVCKISSIRLPKTLKDIGYKVFQHSSLVSVELPEGLETIGEEAFANCSSLKNVTIPSTLNGIPDNVFSGCPVTSLTINSGALISTDFPDDQNVCSKLGISESYLESVVIGNGVKKIGNNAFKGCGDLQNVVIPSGVETIGEYAFVGCYDLPSISLPNTVTFIGKGAFASCLNLESIVLSKNIVDLPSDVFNHCSQLKNIVLPIGLKRIGSECFKWCELLQNFTLPEGIEEIGEGAFYHCKGLTAIDFPSSVKTIGSRAFKECWYLRKIKFREGLQYIGDHAFILRGTFEVDNEMEIILPSTLKEIGICAFDITSVAEDFTVRAITPPVVDTEIMDKDEEQWHILHVPAGTKAVYEKHPVWSKFAEIIDDATIADCATPVLVLKDGKIEKLTCSTPGSKCYYTVTPTEITTYKRYTEEVEPTFKYVVSAYATAPNYTQSDNVEVEVELGGKPNPDINRDGEVNISDITSLVNLILKK